MAARRGVLVVVMEARVACLSTGGGDGLAWLMAWLMDRAKRSGTMDNECVLVRRGGDGGEKGKVKDLKNEEER